MSDNKTMIWFYAGLFLVFALLTYVVDLNCQFCFVRLDSPFISNSFCFAILSGVLTGVIVALAAEVRQYLLHKRQTEATLYALASELYALLSVQRANLKYYINNQDITIPENIGGEYAQQPILVKISYLKSIDYTTFSKRGRMFIALNSFKAHFNKIEKIVRNLIKLQIAHNQTQITFLEKHDNVSKVTAASQIMIKELYEEHGAIKDCLSEIDKFCTAFEEVDGERFNWKQARKIVDDICKKIEENVHFEQELK